MITGYLAMYLGDCVIYKILYVRLVYSKDYETD